MFLKKFKKCDQIQKIPPGLIVACCCGFLANNVASVYMDFKTSTEKELPFRKCPDTCGRGFNQNM